MQIAGLFFLRLRGGFGLALSQVLRRGGKDLRRSAKGGSTRLDSAPACDFEAGRLRLTSEYGQQGPAQGQHSQRP